MNIEGMLENGLEILIASVTTWGLKVVGAVLILIGGYLVAGWVCGALGKWARTNDRVDPTIRPMMLRIVRMLILGVAIVAVLGNFGVQTASVVALLGAAGLAIGLSLQGTLSNVASGVVLLTLRPIAVGDAVEVNGQAGTVLEIGLFATTLQAFDGVMVFLPNSSVWGSVIKNFSRFDVRRFEVGVGIEYGHDAEHAIQVALEVLKADPRVLADPEPSVFVGELADSSVNLVIRGWTASPDCVPTGNDIRKAVKARFDQDGIGIPLPQREVRLLQDA